MIISNYYSVNGKYIAYASKEETGAFKTWPDENGAVPRDMSLGYWDSKDFGRLHVYPFEMFMQMIKQ